MSKGFQGAVLKTLGAKEHTITVTALEKRAPHFLRVWFQADGLLTEEPATPGDWLRVWFPDPDGGAKQFQRGYTIIEADNSADTFALDFVLHTPLGPASYWAANAAAGMQLTAMRYGGHPFALQDPPPAGYLLLGDLAAHPAICSLAEAIPSSSPVVIFLEKHNQADTLLPLPEGENITAHWVESLPDGQALAQAISGGDWADWYVWVTAETVATRRAKTLLMQNFEFNRSSLHAQAYWVRGRAMGKSRTLAAANESLAQAAAAELVASESVSQEPAAPGNAAQPATGQSATPHPTSPHQPTTGQSKTPQPADPPPAAPEPATPQRVLRPARTALICGGIAQGLLTLVGIVPFILFAEVARLLLAGAPPAQFLTAGIVALAVLGASSFGTALLLFAMHLYDAGFAAQLRTRLVRKLGRTPLGWFADQQSIGVKKLVADDVNALHYLVTHAVLDLVAAITAPLAVLVYLFTVSWQLALVLLLPIIAFVFVMVRISARDRQKIMLAQRYQSLTAAQTQTLIANAEQAKIFGTGAIVDLPKTLNRVGEFIEDWQLTTGPAKTKAVMINRPITVLAIILLASWLFLSAGWIAPDAVLPFLVLGTACGTQLLAISAGTGALAAGIKARDSLELFLGTPELAPPTGRSAAAGHIRFDRVGFDYGNGRRVLNNFNLELKPGTVTALVGPSGAGKSTVAALLARLWDPQQGAISIDGTDIRELSAAELYSRVTVLLQDVQLVEGTIAENIALTKPDATPAEIKAAAQAAQIDETIMALPDNYQSTVTDARLSGGERQRIGIARALLADTPIVVLDEATAAADPDSEWAIRQSLKQLLAGKTVLMIAHRLHTVRHADEILVLADGEIVERGTHEQLTAAEGQYFALVNAELAAIGGSGIGAGVDHGGEG